MHLERTEVVDVCARLTYNHMPYLRRLNISLFPQFAASSQCAVVSVWHIWIFRRFIQLEKCVYANACEWACIRALHVSTQLTSLISFHFICFKTLGTCEWHNRRRRWWRRQRQRNGSIHHANDEFFSTNLFFIFNGLVPVVVKNCFWELFNC